MKSLSLGQPHAIVMVGIPGSGKSFFAEKFAETFGAPFVEAALFRHLAKDDEAAELLIQHSLKQLTATGQSIVLEVDTDTRVNRTELAKKLKKLGYQHLFVWVQTDRTTAANRCKKAFGMDKSEYEEKVRNFSPPHESEKPLVISGKHTYASQARMVLKRLSAPRSEAAARKAVPERPNNVVLR